MCFTTSGRLGNESTVSWGYESQRMNQDACDFCAIANGHDESVEVVCSGSSWIAFFPLDPATPGHTLVVPRKHFSDLWDVDETTASDLMLAVVAVGNAIQRALSPEGMNLITSSGSAAEQTVFHVHLHLVPRWSDDGFGRIWPPDGDFEERDKRDVASRIRAECGEAGESQAADQYRT